MPIFGQVDPPSSDNTAGEFADGIKQQVETAGWPCGDYSDDDEDEDDDDDDYNAEQGKSYSVITPLAMINRAP